MALESLRNHTVKKITTGYPAQWRIRIFAIVSMVVILAIIIVITLGIGSTHISFDTILQVLFAKLSFSHIQPAWSINTEIIIFDIRLPRLLLAGLVGAALAVAGATYQGLFRNPLADPYLIGVAQGAALGAVIGFMLPVSWQLGSIPLLAFIGAVSAAVMVYSIARVGKTLPMTTLILAGVAIGAFLAAITSYLMIASGDRLQGIISWLLGSFSLTSWWQVAIVTPYIVIGTLVIWLYARPLNVMQLDEEQAQQLGINVERVKLILLGAATLITGAAVCFCGIIGFVGIIIPHAMRLVWGPDHRLLLPLAAFAGAIFLILADTAARTILAPTEVPVGIITAFLGAPFFLYLLRQKKKVIF
ncbi:MAG TPA: iron chelate uptake ABC transporter family permease subunit [Dehalococcoidia bacterium]